MLISNSYSNNDLILTVSLFYFIQNFIFNFAEGVMCHLMSEIILLTLELML